MLASKLGLLLLLVPGLSSSGAIEKDVSFTIQPAFEIRVLASETPEGAVPLITQQDVLGVRANSSWILTAESYSSGLKSLPSVNLEGKAGEVRRAANQDDNYQIVVSEKRQPISWGDDLGFYRFKVVYSISATL